MTEIFRTFKEKFIKDAKTACDADPNLNRAEMTLLCMKFSRNPIIRDRLDFIDRLFSKIVDFDALKCS